MNARCMRLAFGVAIAAAMSLTAAAQTPLSQAITFQGVLQENGVPLDGVGLADIQVELYDVAAGGNPLYAVLMTNVDFNSGLFTLTMDFGPNAFDGQARWLELRIRKPAGSGPWTLLTPRQPLTAVPYALFALDGSGGGTDADTVDGFHASATPVANRLLALGGNARFPVSVLTMGAASGLDADLLDGQHGAFYQNAVNLNAGTLADLRLSSNVALLNAAQTFTANKYFLGNVGIGIATANAPLDVAGPNPSVPSIVTRGGADYATASGQVMTFGHWDGTNYLTRIRIDSGGAIALAPDGGNVGIGIAAPADKLTILDGNLRLANTADSKNWVLGYDSASDHFYVDEYGVGRRLVIKNGGYVGIGNSSPGYPLHFANSTGEKICFYGPTGGANTGIGLSTTLLMLHGQTAGGGAAFGYGSAASFTEGARITWDGKIGVGTPAPAVRLHAANGTEASLTGGGFLQLGDTTGVNVVMDTDEIMGRNNGVASPLYLNYNGGNVYMGGGAGDLHRVGIGTTTPGGKLDVLADAPGMLRGIVAECTRSLGVGVTATGPVDGYAADMFGRVRVFHRGTNDEAVRIGYGEAGGGGAIVMWNADNEPTVEIDADESSSGGRGAQIALYNSMGQVTINLDADYGNEDIGRLTTDVLEIKGGGDLSERFDVAPADQPPEPGMVVVIDPQRAGRLRLASKPYDRTLAGVISGANGIRPGLLMGQRDSVVEGEHPVALVGRVWCLCDASYGAIEAGDLLTTSATAGHAMRVADDAKAVRGCVIGKAMSSLEKGRGLVLVLVQPQ